jgi:hypothetical protein
VIFEAGMWARFRRGGFWACLALSCVLQIRSDQIGWDLSSQTGTVKAGCKRVVSASGRVSYGPLVFVNLFNQGTLTAPAPPSNDGGRTGSPIHPPSRSPSLERALGLT